VLEVSGYIYIVLHLFDSVVESRCTLEVSGYIYIVLHLFKWLGP